MNELRMPEQNLVLITGRLTRDVETKQVNQTSVANFSIAVNRSYKDKTSGEWRQETSFVNLVAWGKTAEILAERGCKGYPVAVEGRLKSQEWEDKETGKKKSKLVVVVDRCQVLVKKAKVDNLQQEPTGVTIKDENIPF